MKDLWAILRYEFRQSLSIPILIALLLILAAGLGFILLHTMEYKDLQAQKEIFQDVEKNKVEQFVNYRIYGFYGFRVMFLPAPISILFSNSAVVQDMTAYIDSGERLNIYKPLKNKNAFSITKYIFADFSGIFFVFVGLLALFYGFPAFRSQEYLKTLTSIAGKKNLFRNILLARAILLAIYNLLFLASAVLLISLNGVSIGIDQYLVFFFLEMCCLTSFFLVLGVAFGSVKSFNWGQRGIIISWLILLLILPFLLDLIVSVNAATIKPETQLEIEKLKLMMDFEKRSIKKHGYLDLNKDANEAQRGIILDYYKNEFQKMQSLEDQLKAQMQDCKKMHYLLSSFFPTTFYQSLTNELSSKGYETLEDFYNTVKQIKEAFFKEYIKQVYFLPQPTKAEPFLKGDDNIIVGKPALPGYLLLGFCFNLLWITALVMVAYPGFKNRLAELPEKKKNTPSPQDVILHHHKVESFLIWGNLFYKQLYNLLSNDTAEFKNKGYTHQVSIDDKALNTSSGKQNFIALSHPSEIPGDFYVTDYTRLIMDLAHVDKEKRKELETRYSLDAFRGKRFNQLDNDELGQVFFAQLDMKPFDIYLLNDVARDMSLEFAVALNKRMKELANSGALVIFLFSGTDEFSFKSSKTWRYFNESDHWMAVVESFKNAKDEANE